MGTMAPYNLLQGRRHPDVATEGHVASPGTTTLEDQRVEAVALRYGSVMLWRGTRPRLLTEEGGLVNS